MSVEENKTLVRRYFEAIDARRDPAVVDEFLSPDFVSHNPSPGFGSDREGQKGSFAHFLAAAPDSTHVIEAMVAESDTVVSRWTFHGTHENEFAGVAATGRQVSLSGINIDRIVDGKFVERWYEMDRMGLMQQLGVIPAPGQSEEASPT